MLNIAVGGSVALLLAVISFFLKPSWASEVRTRTWVIVLAVGVALTLGISSLVPTVYDAAAVAILSVVSTVTIFTDFIYMMIPKVIQRIGMVAAVAVLVFRLWGEGMTDSTIAYLLGALIGVGLGLFFFILAVVNPKFRKVSGGGDIRMMIVLGLTMQLDPIIWAFVASVIIAVIWALSIKKRKIPYGPALSASAIIAVGIAAAAGVM